MTLMKNTREYQHGGAPERDMRRLGVPPGPVLDFSVNLNPLGPPAVIRDNWPQLHAAVSPYPSVDGKGIAHYYHTVFGVSHRHFLAGNGSTEMIYLVPRVLGFRHAVIITPSYHDYERASRLAGATVVHCPLSPHQGFAFPSRDQLGALLHTADALWIGRPNNPTGTVVSKASILDLTEQYPDTWFIVDEAFIQFLRHWEAESLLTAAMRPNLLVIHSLTKFFAMAGLRLGGIVGDEQIVARLKAAKEPWSVNGIADHVGMLLAACGDYEEETRTMVVHECNRVQQRLRAVAGILPYPSPANYILCQWTRTGNLDDLLRHLLSHGAYVRDCRNFPGLEKNFFRIGLKGRQENDRLLSLLATDPPA